MQAVWRAEDGKIFETKEECRAYESGFMMFNCFGGKTYKAENAVWVYFTHEDGAENFINQCKKENSNYDGISPNCVRLFFYDLYEKRYIHISTDKEAIQEILDAIP